jgi:hypothetical protein
MIQIRNGLRFNIYAGAVIDGVRYPNFTDRSLWPAVGITEVPEPQPPEDYTPEGWVREERDEAPYVIWRPFTEDEIRARIPRRVTMRQARLALLGAGLLEQIDTAINAIEDATQKAAAKIEWEYAQEVDRDHQWVQGLSVALELSEAQLDALFTQAAAL